MKKTKQSLPDKIGVENLIVFVLYDGAAKTGGLNFENLAKQCFEQFPQIFALSGYPKLLDTRKLDRPLRDLRKRGLITGNPKSSFSLTPKGKKIAEDLTKVLRQKKLL